MSSILKLTLPWPNRELSPNYRPPHWSVKAKAVAAARAVGAGLEIPADFTFPKKARFEMTLTLHPAPRRATTDTDNVLSSCKAVIDGIFQNINANDRQVYRTVIERGDCDKNKIGYIDFTLAVME